MGPQVAVHRQRRAAGRPAGQLVQAHVGQPHRRQDGALLGASHEGTYIQTENYFLPAFGVASSFPFANASSNHQWALVLAGIADFGRPAEKLSLQQNGALTATGLIWTRWCLIIKPKNYLLAAVNFFLGVVGVVQVTRIMLWRSSQKNKGAVEEAKDEVKEAVKSA